MVKIGFIVEGDTESIIINSPMFKTFLNKYGFELITPVIDAKGGGNLLPKYLETFITRLNSAGAEKICILTDLENETSTDIVRTRVACEGVDVAFIAIKAIEAWFLADSEAMKRWLQIDTFIEPQPETTIDMPWDRLKEISTQLEKRGPGGSKTAFAKRMINHYHFDIEQAAQHDACSSAAEMVDWFKPETNN